ncbi:MAG: DUF4336 domain-containing protein [Polyangia bacterium]
MSCLRTYEPVGRLKPVTDDVWIADGDELRMRYYGLRLPFTPRMTVVRLPDGGLWLHSPIAPSEALATEIGALGEVRWIVAPNRLHTSFTSAWHARFPAASVASVAAEPPWSGAPLPSTIDLAGSAPLPWAPSLATRVVHGSLFSEAVFFHAASRTLILTDLIENFERSRITCLWLRALLAVTGPLDPHGTAPPDMRFSFRKQRAELRTVVQELIGWDPERVIIAHGRWYPTNGRAELERAFAWVR